MCGVNEAVETIIIYKANLMKNSSGFEEHIRNVLKEHAIISSETSEETVGIFVKVFKMGGVDAMIFDVAGALDFSDLKRHDERQKMLAKIFPPE